MGRFEPGSRCNQSDALPFYRTPPSPGAHVLGRVPTEWLGRTSSGARRRVLPEGTQFAPDSYLYEVQRAGARRRCSSVRLSNHPGLMSLVAYAGCPVARECLVVQVEFHSVSGVSTRGPLDHNISPQTTCVFVRPLCYARTPRKTNIIVFMYKTK